MYSERYTTQDAAGIVALYTRDGVLVSPSATNAVKSGTQAIGQTYEDISSLGTDYHLNLTVGQVARLADGVIIAWGGEYHATAQAQNGLLKFDGDWTGTYVRDNGTWKLRLATAIPKPPPLTPR